MAQFMDDALTIWPCRQANASRIYKNQKINGRCYEYMPAIVKEQLMFISSGVLTEEESASRGRTSITEKKKKEKYEENGKKAKNRGKRRNTGTRVKKMTIYDNYEQLLQ
uniref:Uncharacterized protein n=1 Tax=Romanomermis culicivorax TaxID=13658 RepID=A0A915J800_ROMCU